MAQEIEILHFGRGDKDPFIMPGQYMIADDLATLEASTSTPVVLTLSSRNTLGPDSI